MSDLPPPETTPTPQPYPEIDPPASPDEAPIGTPAPDDGRPYD
ncbi:hypothetical protein [Caulobacter sp. S45]|nr:hypothetical protein [Caulobacter sp. S45]